MATPCWDLDPAIFPDFDPTILPASFFSLKLDLTPFKILGTSSFEN
jgi:hypothetical protein